MKLHKILSVLVLAGLLTSGCQMMNTGLTKAGYQKIDDANKKIEQIENNYNQQLAQNNKDWEKKLNDKIDIMFKQMQGASDELFAVDLAWSYNLNPDRNALVMHNHAANARDYIHLQPSQQAVDKYLKEIKDELDVSKTTIADLKKKSDEEHKKAEELANEKKDVDQKLEQLKRDEVTILQNKDKDLNQARKEKDIATAKVLQQQREDLQKEKEHDAKIQTLMKWTGALAVLAILAAIYFPLMREESVITAIIFGGITLALPFIEGWMIAVGAGVGGAALLAWIFLKHNNTVSAKNKALELEQKVNKNLVNVIQDVKENAKDVFDSHIKPALTEWNTVVKQKEDGTIEKVPDKQVMDAIDQKLIASDRK